MDTTYAKRRLQPLCRSVRPCLRASLRDDVEGDSDGDADDDDNSKVDELWWARTYSIFFYVCERAFASKQPRARKEESSV